MSVRYVVSPFMITAGLTSNSASGSESRTSMSMLDVALFAPDADVTFNVTVCVPACEYTVFTRRPCAFSTSAPGVLHSYW